MQNKYQEAYNNAKDKAGSQEGILIFATEQEYQQKWALLSALVNSITNAPVRASLGNTAPRILDVGCGYCDIMNFLDKKWYRYTGLDVTDWIVAYAKQQHPDLTVQQGDLKTFEYGLPFELTLSIGTMATLDPAEDITFLEDLLRSTWKTLIISYQDKAKYKGSFRSFRTEDLQVFFQSRGCKMEVHSPDWETETYAVITTKE